MTTLGRTRPGRARIRARAWALQDSVASSGQGRQAELSARGSGSGFLGTSPFARTPSPVLRSGPDPGFDLAFSAFESAASATRGRPAVKPGAHARSGSIEEFSHEISSSRRLERRARKRNSNASTSRSSASCAARRRAASASGAPSGSGSTKIKGPKVSTRICLTQLVRIESRSRSERARAQFPVGGRRSRAGTGTASVSRAPEPARHDVPR